MLKKKMLRDIKLNLSQFITIFLMVLIGVMAYSGINAYMSGMQKTADKFYSKTKLDKEKSVDKVKQGLSKYGTETVERFDSWCKLFLGE